MAEDRDTMIKRVMDEADPLAAACREQAMERRGEPLKNVFAQERAAAPPGLSLDEIVTRFVHHPPDGEQIGRHRELRRFARDFAVAVVLKTPTSREQSLALAKIEEAVMWANAAIARRE